MAVGSQTAARGARRDRGRVSADRRTSWDWRRIGGVTTTANPTFFTPLIWTADLVKGANADQSLSDGACPAQTPVALDVAQICALAAVFLSVVGVAMALFQSRVDRLRVYFARSVTAVVDMDDDAQSMVSAVARSMDHRGTLAVITANPDRPCVQEARAQGARVLAVNLTNPATLTVAFPVAKARQALSAIRGPVEQSVAVGAPSPNASRISTSVCASH